MNEQDWKAKANELYKVMSKVFDAYIDAQRGPDDAVVDAYADIFGCSPNEFRKWFGRYARSRGSNLFFAHYPAFGEEGCEFNRDGSQV